MAGSVAGSVAGEAGMSGLVDAADKSVTCAAPEWGGLCRTAELEVGRATD